MGHRANLVLAHEDHYELYYCHGCSISIPQDLFWGPEAAIAHIKNHEAVTHNGWLNETWAEGGVLIDTKRKVLIFYGGQDLLYDIPFRRLYLELLSIVWQDWQVKWAWGGIAEIGAYVGVNQDRFSTATSEPDEYNGLNPLEEQQWARVICSIRLQDGSLTLYPESVAYPDMLLRAGPAVIESAAKVRGYDVLPLQDWNLLSFPLGGLHIDIPQFQLSYWSALDGDLRAAIQPRWRDWDITWLEDSYEKHLELAGHKFTLPSVSHDALLSQLEGTLMSTRRHGGELIKDAIKRLVIPGNQLQVNRHALIDSQPQLPTDDKERTFAAVVRQWKAKHHG